MLLSWVLPYSTLYKKDTVVYTIIIIDCIYIITCKYKRKCLNNTKVLNVPIHCKVKLVLQKGINVRWLL